jgi:hypothetical protein
VHSAGMKTRRSWMLREDCGNEMEYRSALATCASESAYGGRRPWLVGVMRGAIAKALLSSTREKRVSKRPTVVYGVSVVRQRGRDEAEIIGKTIPRGRRSLSRKSPSFSL